MTKTNRSSILRVRVTEAEAEDITRHSEMADLSVSAYLRKRVLGHQVQSTCDMRMLALLNKLGGLTKKMHVSGQHQEAARIAAGLDGIRRAIEAGNGR